MDSSEARRIFGALETFRIEIPSWGFANTGTRFGKFLQAAAATTPEEKFSDAAEVHRVTGICPTIALHVLWDLPNGMRSTKEITALTTRYGIQAGSINPNLFQDQIYKHGSFGNPDAAVRSQALQHTNDSIQIAHHLQSRDISMWFADGSSYPGTANIRQRKALHLARCAGPQAKVLVDTGHHYHSQNIEQIVAWLLSEKMLGGFHFNDRRYADDDLTIGSIDPYQVFRIFHEILYYEWETGQKADIAYMIDQSHNLKGKIEETIQTVTMAQQLFAKAALVDHAMLSQAQMKCKLISAESLLQDAFNTDVRPAIQEWRVSKGLPPDPLKTFLESGYMERITNERRARNMNNVSSYA